MRQVFESYHSIFRVNIRQKTEKKRKNRKRRRDKHAFLDIVNYS